MRNIGFKTLTTLLAMSRRSRRHVDATLAVVILSTIVTLSLIVIYLSQKIADFP